MSDNDPTDVVRMSRRSTFCYTWTFSRFCYCCSTYNKRSQNFNITVDGNEYTFYIRANTSSSDKCIKFCLYRCDHPTSMDLQLKYSILNREGKLTNTKECNYSSNYVVEYVSLEKPCNLTSNNSCSSSLTVVLEVTSQRISNFQENTLDSRLLNDLQLLFQNEKFSDLTIAVEHQEFRVHKAILASRSPVFLAMLENDMIEKQNNRVQIDDIDYETMKHVLLYIYTGKVENLDLAGKLLGPADKYALDGLKDKCADVLSEAITVENVVETLKLADLYRANKLKENAIDFMAIRFKDVTATEGFKLLLKSDSHLFETS